MLGDHSSKPRNRNIANAFYKAGFIESWGRGISKIFDGIKAAKLATPLLESTMGGVSLTIYRKGYVDDHVKDTVNDTVKITHTELSFLKSINQNTHLTYTEIMQIHNVSRPTVARTLKKLQQYGMLIRQGSDKAGMWLVTEKGKKQINK